jgi:hypothetical protein
MKPVKLVLAAAALACCVLPAGRAAAQTPTAVLSAYGGDAAATGIHILSYTNGLTNFATGFVDNAYPLANTHLDAAPATQAVASIADSGPLGATAQGVVAPHYPLEQPQYAIAKYPGPASDSLSQGGSVAEVTADANSATAHGAYVAGSVDDARSSVKVDQIAGTVLGESTGHVSGIVFGDGLLKITGVDVSARVLVEGTKVTPHYEINVASATVNDMPVQITDKGVVVQGEPLPGSDAMTAVVNEQLNAALASSGLSVFVTPPQIKTDQAQATVSVSGVHVHYTAPNPDPSVPTLTYDYILGEARAFGFGVAGVSSDDSLLGGVETSLPDLTNVEGTSTDLGDVSGAVTELTPETGNASLRPPARSLNAAPASFRRPRPTWLVPIYLIWQALVLATGGVLLWSRRDTA